MKRCPACNRVYDDDSLRFCLDDGSNLVDKIPATAALPTLALPELPVPTIKEAFRPAVPTISETQPHSTGPSVSKKRSALPWLIGIVAVLLLGSGIVLGVWILRPKPALPWHLVLETKSDSVNQTVEVLKSRLDAYGVSNFQVLPQGNGRIQLNLPGINDPDRLKAFLTNEGKLELTHVIGPPNPAPVQAYASKEEAIASLNSGGSVPANRQVVPYAERSETASTKWVVVELPAIVKNSDLRDARAAPGASGDYQIQFSLNQNGADRFGAWTGANINHYLAVVLNDEVKSVAYIRSQISDQGQISGRFTKQFAEDLAMVLRSGAFPEQVTLVDETIDKP